MKEGKLIVLSAPSGTGKTTICKELLKRNKDWLFSVSVTTRDERNNEIPNKDYIFITNEKFDHLIKFGDIFEYEWVHGNRYGTLMAPLEDAINNQKIMLFFKNALSLLNLDYTLSSSIMILMFGTLMAAITELFFYSIGRRNAYKISYFFISIGMKKFFKKNRLMYF